MKTRLACLILIVSAQALLGADRRFGWVPDKGGVKDAQYSAHRTFKAAAILPASDLRAQMPPIMDQGALGSCVGNGAAAVLDYAHAMGPRRFVFPSRLFIYYNGRRLAGTVHEDSGLQIRDGIKAVFTWGACGEKTKRGWAYDVSRFTEEPPAACYKAAEKRQALKAYKVDHTDGRSIRIALSAGFPVVFGGYVYEDIQRLDARHDVLPMPRGRPIGGHCMVIVGHDDAMQADGQTGFYLVRNSWGTRWGNAGHCWMPYAYAHDWRRCDDFWVIETAE